MNAKASTNYKGYSFFHKDLIRNCYTINTSHEMRCKKVALPKT